MWGWGGIWLCLGTWDRAGAQPDLGMWVWAGVSPTDWSQKLTLCRIWPTDWSWAIHPACRTRSLSATDLNSFPSSKGGFPSLSAFCLFCLFCAPCHVPNSLLHKFLLFPTISEQPLWSFLALRTHTLGNCFPWQMESFYSWASDFLFTSVSVSGLHKLNMHNSP